MNMDYSNSSVSSNSSPVYSPDTTGYYLESEISESPYLEIIEQPTSQYRFRYLSELQGTPHGPLTGQTSSKHKKTFPTVKLHNYDGEAEIMCWLVESKGVKDTLPTRSHAAIKPHCHSLVTRRNSKIIEEPHKERVSRQNDYTASFENLVVLHSVIKDKLESYPAKKKKWQEWHYPDENFSSENDRKKTQMEMKNMDKNIVYLYFEAIIEYSNSKEILCRKISTEVKNLKAAKTGELKIFRQSSFSGSTQGGDEVFIFVSKIPKEVKVQFYCQQFEWNAYASFTPNDIHTNSAIAFKSPMFPYDINDSVETKFRLLREEDGAVSNACSFTYIQSRGQRRKLPEEDKEDLVSTKRKRVQERIPQVPNLTLARFEDQPNKVIVEPLKSNSFNDFEECINELPTGNSFSFPSSELDELKRTLDVDEIENSLQMDGPNPFSLCDGRMTKHKKEKRKLSDDEDNDNYKSYFYPSFGGNSRKSIGLKCIILGIPVIALLLFSISTVSILCVVILVLHKSYNLCIIQTNDVLFFINFVIAKVREYFLKLKKYIFQRRITFNDMMTLHHIDLFNNIESGNFKLFCNNIDKISRQDHSDLINEAFNGKIILHEAILHQEEKFVNKLLSCEGINMSLKDSDGNTGAHLAAGEDSLSILQLLVHHGAHYFLEQVNYDGFNCLHIATKKNKIKNVEFLTTVMDVNLMECKADNTSLHIAVDETKNADIVRQLLKGGIDVNAENRRGFTPLDMAILNNDLNMATLLIESEAIVKDLDEYSEEFGQENFDEKMVALLTRNKSKVIPHNLKTNDGALLSDQEIEAVVSLLEKNDNWKRLAKILEMDISFLGDAANPSRVVLNYLDVHRIEVLGERIEDQLKEMDRLLDEIGLRDARNVVIHNHH